MELTGDALWGRPTLSSDASKISSRLFINLIKLANKQVKRKTKYLKGGEREEEETEKTVFI